MHYEKYQNLLLSMLFIPYGRFKLQKLVQSPSETGTINTLSPKYPSLEYMKAERCLLLCLLIIVETKNYSDLEVIKMCSGKWWFIP